MVPTLAYNCEQILRNNTYYKQQHLVLRCDGMDKNKNVATYVCQTLKETLTSIGIRSVDKRFQYTYDEILLILKV